MTFGVVYDELDHNRMLHALWVQITKPNNIQTSSTVTNKAIVSLVMCNCEIRSI